MDKELTVREEGLNPFGSIKSFVDAQRMAEALASSSLVPREFQRNVGNTLLALEISSRLRMPVFSILQNCHVIHGKPGFSAAFQIAVINQSGRFDRPLMFHFNKEKTSCFAWTELDGERIEGPTIDMKMAAAEGWVGKPGSKWKTMPEMMLRYRSATFFARLYASDLLMGMHSPEEIAEEERLYQENGTAADMNRRFGVATSVRQDDSAVDGEVIPVDSLEEKAANGQEKGQSRRRPKTVADFKADIDAKENSVHLGNWRGKHTDDIIRQLPDEADQQEVFGYAKERYQALRRREKEARNTPPPPDEEPQGPGRNGKPGFIRCPDIRGNVSAEYCDTECSARQGCPAHNDETPYRAKLDIEV